MATQTTRLSVDMDPKEHRKLKILAEANGMTLKEFILALLEPVLYPSKKPNRETQNAIDNVEKGKKLRSFESVEHMWKELGLDE